MPSTKEIVNYLELQAPGWNRTGVKGLLEILNQAQNILYEQATYQTMGILSSGTLPYIATVADTYEYTLNQATTGLNRDIWRVDAVMLQTPFSNEISSTLNVGYGILPNIRQPVKPMELNGIEYFIFHQVDVADSLRSGYPVLKFLINPGTTTQDYYLLCYKKAIQLSSESIRLSLPEALHLTALLPAAQLLVKAFQNGTIVEAMEIIENTYKPRVRKAMNEGDHGIVHSITRYEE